ncbi:MAG: aspartate carbamoyltransferase regulatory subunit [Nanoarchaeota archaeon]|nr:aspartate carbamoyltransferase regulatory subunit [Nanoarchaeota archaeon]
MKELKVTAIENGSVIDHIPTDNTFNVIGILKLDRHDDTILIATNLPSKKLGKKGIVKVSGRQLTKDEANKIALVAPDATINIIKDFEIVEKLKASLPKQLVNVSKCFNPNCITNRDSVVPKLCVESARPLRLRCEYCERSMTQKDIQLV